MAIELGKVNTQDLTNNDYKILGIGINKRSDSSGIFAVNYTTIKQAKDNLVNLIMTKKGERVMQPDFGCDVHRVVFEPITEGETQDRIITYIEDAVAIWLPYIIINSVEFNNFEENIDNNKIDISIRFSLKINPNISEMIQISLK